MGKYYDFILLYWFVKSLNILIIASLEIVKFQQLNKNFYFQIEGHLHFEYE